MRLVPQILLCSALVLSASSCNRSWSIGSAIDGDGTIVTDTRTLATYTDIDFEGSYDVVVSQGAESSIRIETDKNILPHVKTEVKGGKLTVTSDANINPSKRMKVYLSSPNYSSIDIEGAADVQGATPIKSDNLSLELSGSGSYTLEVHTKTLKTDIEGSGKVTLTGDVTDHKVIVDGSGDLIALQMPAVTTNVDISGSGDAQVFVMQRLDANISGSGNIRYKGAVTDVHTSVSGSGKVEKVE